MFIGYISGQWTQDEYQNLFDLVNLDLRVKAHQEYDAGNRKVKFTTVRLFVGVFQACCNIFTTFHTVR